MGHADGDDQRQNSEHALQGGVATWQGLTARTSRGRLLLALVELPLPPPCKLDD